MLVGLKRISTALALVAGLAAATHAQGVAPSANQATANAVAGALQSSRALSGYRIEIETREGLVTLSGTVKTAAQKTEALTLAQSVAGVAGVVDQLKLAGDNRVRTVSTSRRWPSVGTASPTPAATSFTTARPLARRPRPSATARFLKVRPGAPGGGPRRRRSELRLAELRSLPEFLGRRLPHRLPVQAWPNIAPPYPYPEVPLDWRAVTLRWDDGICGSTSRSTTPGRSSPRIRSGSSPTETG